MTIRKTVTLIEEINSEYGARASPPLRRIAIAAVFENPLAGKAAGADLKPLIEYSLKLGGFAHQDGAGDTWREPSAAARLHRGGAGRHRRRPRAWRGDDTSETRHGDAPRDQTRSRYHSGPRQGGAAGHDRRSDLWAPRRGLGSRCL